MKIMMSVSVILLAIFMPLVPAYCQGDSIVDDMKTVDGNVISVDSSNSKIVVRTSEIITFSVSPDAKIVDADGFNIQLSDVSAGNYVTVDYHDDGAGNHIMEGMEVAYNR
jgi:hypothetical protein